MMDVEFIIFLSILGCIPILTLDVSSDLLFQLSSIPSYFSIVFILSAIPQFTKNISGGFQLKKGFKSINISLVGLIVLFMYFSQYSFLKLISGFNNLLGSQLIINNALRPSKEESAPISKGSIQFDRPSNGNPQSVLLAHTFNYLIVNKLLSLARLEKQIKKNTILYIPPSNQLYWGHNLDKEIANSFLGPSLSGLPLLAGFIEVKEDQEAYKHIGFRGYNPTKVSQFHSDAKERDLCARAESKGFHRIVVLDQEGSALQERRFNCQDDNIFLRQ